MRGIVRGKSKGSRFRQLANLKQIDQQAAPIEQFRNATLTYQRPDVEPAQAAADLKRLCDTMRDKFPNVAWHWAIEAQSRGTPHFHLLVYAPAGHNLDAGGPIHVAMMTRWHKIAGEGSEAHRWFHLEKNQDKSKRHGPGEVDAWERVASWTQLQKYLSAYIAKDAIGYEGVRPWGVHNRARFPSHIDHVDLTDAQFNDVRRQMRRLYEKTPNGRASVTVNALNGRGVLRPLWKFYVRGSEARSYECKLSLAFTGGKSGHWAWTDPTYVRRLVRERGTLECVRRYRRRLRNRGKLEASAAFFVGSVATVYRLMQWARERRPADEDDHRRRIWRAGESFGHYLDGIERATNQRRERQEDWSRLCGASRRRRRDEDLDRLQRLGQQAEPVVSVELEQLQRAERRDSWRRQFANVPGVAIAPPPSPDKQKPPAHQVRGRMPDPRLADGPRHRIEA